MSKETDKITGKETIVVDKKSAADPAKDKTRIYDVPVRSAIKPSEHRWIDDDDEEVIKPVGRNTMAIRKTMTDIDRPQDAQLDRNTRIGRDSNTRIVGTRASRGTYDAPESGGTEDSGFADTARAVAARAGAGLKAAASATRDAVESLRRVKVGDSAKFRRFLKVMGVMLIVLLLEIGYFAFANHVKKMPSEIKETQKELELTQKENELLTKELDELGDYDSTEELRQSWERLRDKVKNAVEETSY
jgi:hypothetical protein